LRRFQKEGLEVGRVMKKIRSIYKNHAMPFIPPPQLFPPKWHLSLLYTLLFALRGRPTGFIIVPRVSAFIPSQSCRIRKRLRK
jgi:hypothetical protein